MSSTSPPKDPTRIGRSALVGLVATIVDLLSPHILVSTFHVSPEHANVPSLSLGLALQFLGNKYYAFDDRSAQLVRQGGLFLVVEVGALALNALVFHLLVTSTGAHYLVTRVLGSAVVYFGFSYPLWTRIFQQGGR